MVDGSQKSAKIHSAKLERQYVVMLKSPCCRAVSQMFSRIYLINIMIFVSEIFAIRASLGSYNVFGRPRLLLLSSLITFQLTCLLLNYYVLQCILWNQTFFNIVCFSNTVSSSYVDILPFRYIKCNIYCIYCNIDYRKDTSISNNCFYQVLLL